MNFEFFLKMNILFNLFKNFIKDIKKQSNLYKKKSVACPKYYLKQVEWANRRHKATHK